ncbi:6298_t:CDS:1 [Gigaspora margarita]|uniref:MATA-HMG n=2 Tax=Gigaspora margarita TaxID=4874 RepID=A0A8H4A5V3_GIGMA|nr:MATA-HMG [Gigaspora margarita]CAG8788464.1 6298_t:CDS:1 [Gigaspora margarita]
MSKYQSNFLANPTHACVFINSGNDPMTQNQVIDDPRQLVQLPFPPKIDPRDLVISHNDGRIPKPPNAFIIYRKMFVETARASGYNLPMNIISSMASRSWEQELDEVKNEYKRIAKEAFKYRNELFPKVKPQKKRDQWKTVSFDKPSIRKVKMTKPMKSVNKPTKHQVETSTLKSELVLNDNLLSPEFSPELLSEVSLESSPELFNDVIDVNSSIFNIDLFADWANFLDNQNIYPSPDLTTSSNHDSPSINDDFEFDLEMSSPAQYIDLPIQKDQQANEDITNNFLYINDDQYGLGIFDISNTTSEINSHNLHEMFNIQNTCISEQLSFSDLLNTTINQDYLNDALISYEMGF